MVLQGTIASALEQAISGREGCSLVEDLANRTNHARSGDGDSEVDEQGEQCGHEAEHLEVEHDWLKVGNECPEEGGRR